jgi:hypothetical protein
MTLPGFSGQSRKAQQLGEWFHDALFNLLLAEMITLLPIGNHEYLRDIKPTLKHKILYNSPPSRGK